MDNFSQPKPGGRGDWKPNRKLTQTRPSIRLYRKIFARRKPRSPREMPDSELLGIVMRSSTVAESVLNRGDGTLHGLTTVKLEDLAETEVGLGFGQVALLACLLEVSDRIHGGNYATI
jgi:DNA repair protein RadC